MSIGGEKDEDEECTQVVCDLVCVLEVLHSEADDIHKVVHQPEKLFDVWPKL